MPLIKVLVGIRRCGKSTILDQVRQVLLGRGVPETQIIHVNFNTIEYAEVRSREDFLAMVRKAYQDDGVRYFLFDEVQEVEGWDEVVNALFSEEGTDIYLTGSNSKMLASELSTYLTGRYVNIRVSTLNFAEFIDFKKALNPELPATAELFSEYKAKGGFPIIHTSDQPESLTDNTVFDIYNSIVLKDLVERKKIRNTELLTRIVKFIFDNIGNTFSAKSISDYLKSQQRGLSQETVYNYLDWLAEAFIIEKVARYDVRGKAHLKTQEKYYLGDIGILYAVNGRSASYDAGLLENLVYHELIAKGYNVSIGKNGDREIDFIAEKNHQLMYLQVALALGGDRKVIDREFGAFEGIEDSYPKYVLTLEDGITEDRGGIQQRYLPRFILENL